MSKSCFIPFYPPIPGATVCKMLPGKMYRVTTHLKGDLMVFSGVFLSNPPIRFREN